MLTRQLHPLDGQPTPRFTMQQWQSMFGGREHWQKNHQTLLECGRSASRIQDGKSKTVSNTAKTLARVLAEMTDSPVLRDSLPDNIIAHNKLLSSWKLDFWL